MTSVGMTDGDIAELARSLRERGEPFAIATVIRTAGPTAAKPGAKALLDMEGRILQGWIGGGCVRSAMAKAVSRARADGQPQLISLHPQDVLDGKGITAGDVLDGVRFARSECPSKGSVDIFVEMILPQPELLIYGESPVARALATLAERFGWSVACPGPEFPESIQAPGRIRMVVVATQGQGDLAALRAALAQESRFVAMVASGRKFSDLAERLAHEGIPEDALAAVQAPAGIPIHAVTPDEIALSILAQLTLERRRHYRAQV